MGISGRWSWDCFAVARSPGFLEIAASGPFLRARKVWDSPGKNESRNSVARQEWERNPRGQASSSHPSKAVLGSSRDKSPLCVRARGHLRAPVAADCGWAVGGTGTEETGADQELESVHGKRGVLLRWEESWKQCHVLQEEITKFPTVSKIMQSYFM